MIETLKFCCEFSESVFGVIKLVWLSGKREKEIIRFAVRNGSVLMFLLRDWAIRFVCLRTFLSVFFSFILYVILGIYHTSQFMYLSFTDLDQTVFSAFSARNLFSKDTVSEVSFPESPMESSAGMNLTNGKIDPSNDTSSKPFKVFVGYDPREDIAYQVCRYSMLKRASIPVEVIPIKQSELRKKGLYWRERGKLESTEFSFSRFLTPYLANYDGWAMFVDCDFLYLADIKDLRDLADDNYAIMCVQHDYAPKETTKMDGAVQTVYPRKNWSSMVLYNCGHLKNRLLTPDVVNSQTGAYLHRFMWLDDHEIGSVPFVWNFLVGHNKVVEGDPSTLPRAIHYTLGGPWFENWKNCEFADLWVNEMEECEKEMKNKKE